MTAPQQRKLSGLICRDRQSSLQLGQPVREGTGTPAFDDRIAQGSIQSHSVAFANSQIFKPMAVRGAVRDHPTTLTRPTMRNCAAQTTYATANPKLKEMLYERVLLKNLIKLQREKFGSLRERHGREHPSRFCNGKNSVDWQQTDQPLTSSANGSTGSSIDTAATAVTTGLCSPLTSDADQEFVRNLKAWRLRRCPVISYRCS